MMIIMVLSGFSVEPLYQYQLNRKSREREKERSTGQSKNILKIGFKMSLVVVIWKKKISWRGVCLCQKGCTNAHNVFSPCAEMNSRLDIVWAWKRFFVWYSSPLCEEEKLGVSGKIALPRLWGREPEGRLNPRALLPLFVENVSFVNPEKLLLSLSFSLYYLWVRRKTVRICIDDDIGRQSISSTRKAEEKIDEDYHQMRRLRWYHH